MLHLDVTRGALFKTDGQRFDPGTRTWRPGEAAPGGQALSEPDAVRWLQGASGAPCRVPIGVIGPRAATARQAALAEQVGAGLARLGLTVLCGGREGVMEAVCRGVAAAGGLSIGLLPDDDWGAANPYVAVPLATGIGVARNAIIARAALCLVAIGGGAGTLSEIAFGLQFGRPVFTLEGAPEIAGVVPLDDAPAVEAAVARIVLAL